MTRAVVVGPYPPSPDPAAAATLAEVRALRGEGHDVLVISPEPSAARIDASPTTRRGARRIARSIARADVVVWVGEEPPRVVAHALRDIPDVRIRFMPRPTEPTAGIAEQVLTRAALLRAGAPTFVRSLRRR
jgi:hypothetical protein